MNPTAHASCSPKPTQDQPQHPVPLLFLGQLARQEGKVDAARRDLDTAASLPLPENWPPSHRKRFLILLHSERFQFAKQLKDETLARDALTAWFKSEPENKQLQDLFERVEAAEKP